MSRFHTTRWSLILAARADTRAGHDALAALCAAYRPAILAYLRRFSASRSDAEDLAQGFFERFLEKRLHEVADPLRGSFRVFLRTALENYASHVREAANTQRRGGRLQHAELEDEPGLASGEGRDTPESAFELTWALTVLERAMARLEREAVDSGKSALFAALRDFLTETPEAEDYRRIAGQLAMRENTIAVAVHRLRKRLREMVRAELAETVADPTEVEHEVRAIREVLKHQT